MLLGSWELSSGSLDRGAIYDYAKSCADATIRDKLEQLLGLVSGPDSKRPDKRLDVMSSKPAGVLALQGVAQAWWRCQQQKAAIGSCASTSSSAAGPAADAAARTAAALAKHPNSVLLRTVCPEELLAALPGLRQLSTEVESDMPSTYHVCISSSVAVVHAHEVKREYDLATAVKQLHVRTAVAAYTVKHLHGGMRVMQRVAHAYVPQPFTAQDASRCADSVAQARTRAEELGMALEVHYYEFP